MPYNILKSSMRNFKGLRYLTSRVGKVHEGGCIPPKGRLMCHYLTSGDFYSQKRLMLLVYLLSMAWKKPAIVDYDKADRRFKHMWLKG
jgi:hypothetical protein